MLHRRMGRRPSVSPKGPVKTWINKLMFGLTRTNGHAQYTQAYAQGTYDLRHSKVASQTRIRPGTHARTGCQASAAHRHHDHNRPEVSEASDWFTIFSTEACSVGSLGRPGSPIQPTSGHLLPCFATPCRSYRPDEKSWRRCGHLEFMSDIASSSPQPAPAPCKRRRLPSCR